MHSGSFGLQINAPNSIKASTKSEFLLALNKSFLLISISLAKLILFSFLLRILENTLLTFPSIAIDGNVKRIFSRILNKNENKIDFNKLIEVNKKNLFKNKRNSDFVEALMEFGALICKPKVPKCYNCGIKNMCKYFQASRKFKQSKILKTKVKNYDIFCYIDKMKNKIALTKNHNLGFLDKFYLPPIKETSKNKKIKNWKFHSNFKKSISNKKLNINLYYTFSLRIPSQHQWFSMKKNNEFIPSFTKKILKKISKID